MYANYNRSEFTDESEYRALELKAQGIDSSRSSYADLLNKPSNFYAAPCTDYEGNKNCISKVKFQETSTIFNSAQTDPQIRAALTHRIIMEDVSGLIDDTDRKFMSYICYAIVRGDIDALKKLLNGVAKSIPHKLSAYISTLNDHFTNLRAGICFSFQSKDMILLHMYHSNSALAIDPSSSSAAVLPIFTDWDGTVFCAEAEAETELIDSEELLAAIQEQCIRRILMNHEDNPRPSLPIVRDEVEHAEYQAQTTRAA